MIKKIDYFLDRITMYRLVFYVLLGLIAIALIFSFFGWLPFSPYSLFVTFCFITLLCWATNILFAKVFSATTNIESVYITAFILTLIVSPIQSLPDVFRVGWIAVISVASKYILAIKGKHIFNPAAIAVVLSSISYGFSASWWVGTVKLLPFVLVGGFLIIKKLRFEKLFFSFIVINFLFTLLIDFGNMSDMLKLLSQTFLNTPLIFFATIMLTEPSTLPPTNNFKILYGGLIGFLTVPKISFAGFYPTPEIALVIGNIFSYIVSSKQKLVLVLKEKIRIAPDVFDFIFVPKTKLAFEPGQYMEWTFEHQNPDSRGNRRYLTIASSPTEDDLRLGIKFYPNGSSFKKSLLNFGNNSKIVGAQLAGDFTLPKDPVKKLVFMAGGIGITPFRSIIKYLTDKREKRDIILFYSNKVKEEIVYKDVFDAASAILGIRVVYVLSEVKLVPPYWDGEVGRINSEKIIKYVPDYKERIFYLSGPQPMVLAYEKVLKDMGVSVSQIKKDYFPGYA